MGFKTDLRSENGAATVLEATIIYPLVCLVTVLLVFVCLTYAQQGFLTYHSHNLAGCLMKVICYPGYQFIDDPYNDSSGTVTITDIDKAMSAQAPYRYLFGVFGGEYKADDCENEDIIAKYVKFMAEDYLTKHGFLKPSGGDVPIPTNVKFSSERVSGTQNGYVCAISANTSRVVVYLGQNYMFANFFRMIGMGGREQLMQNGAYGVPVYTMDSSEQLSAFDDGMIMNNTIKGVIGYVYEQRGDGRVITYNEVRGMRLSLLRGKNLGKQHVLSILISIADVIIASEDYMLIDTNFVLDDEYIFIETKCHVLRQ